MGPVIGSFVYDAVGFKATFFIFGASMAPITVLILCYLPGPMEVREKKKQPSPRQEMSENMESFEGKSEFSIELISPEIPIVEPKKKLGYSNLICN